MMRLITTLLFTALFVLGIWSFFDSTTFLFGPEPLRDNGAQLLRYNWWWPTEVSTFGEDIDFLFKLISWMILVFFVLTYVILIVGVFRFSKRSEDKGVFSHGNHRLETLWTGVPAILLLVIAFSQMGTWHAIKFRGAVEGEERFAEAYANQFDWRFRYPGADGRYGTFDDFETASEMVVPVDEKIVFDLRSRDVLHSFFVPKLRLKQDAVPGMTIPVWFQVDPEEFAAEANAFEDEEGNAGRELAFDLICAELCGWGHYKMAGRIRVLDRASYDRWMEEQTAHELSNGKPEEM